VAMLRGELVAAQEYAKKRETAEKGKEPARSLKLDMLERVLKGELPLLVTAHRARDIMSALRVADEFKIKVVIDGGAEAYLVKDEIKRAGVPVIIHATMFRASGETENLSFETASVLRAAGIPVALQSGFEGYVPKTRVLLFEAAVAAANGLGLEGALAASTIDAARILGLGARIGSLEAGKDGDLALYDGDPFEYTSHCVGTVIDGDVVHEGPDS
jgi:imidazolonepropionase-like amidohydrolase